MEIFCIENLNFKYLTADKSALENVSLRIDQGEFVVLCGHSGCGKTTLLRMLKKQLAPYGEKQGNVYYMGNSVDLLDDEVSAREIGFVMQDPESQIVTDKVWHELSFGLENIGLPANLIRRRIGEISGYFGIENIFEKNVCELSGGQKQMLNLAAVMAMDPKVLILDEPTSQLDPIAASDYISTLKRINRERSLTIIMSEHRLEEVFDVADKLVVMKDSKIISCGTPQDVCRMTQDDCVLAGLPVPVRLYKKFPFGEDCPMNVRDGKTYLEKNFKNEIRTLEFNKTNKTSDFALKIKNVSFRYEKDGKDVLKDISLEVFEGEVLCILGGNATGKTTLLKIISSILKPYRGSVEHFVSGEKCKGKSPKRKTAYLPQNPDELFIKDSVMEDLELVCPEKTGEEKIEKLAKRFGVESVLKCHPYDLSYGELQRCAIVKVLLTDPDIVVLDEPTKGIDAFSKSSVCDVIGELKKDGKTVMIATHDTEFAADCADRCAFLFSGEVVSCENPCEFFSGNIFYTTSASRMSRDFYDNAVTLDDIVKLCEINGRAER